MRVVLFLIFCSAFLLDGCAMVCCGEGTATNSTSSVRAGGEVKDVLEGVGDALGGASEAGKGGVPTRAPAIPGKP